MDLAWGFHGSGKVSQVSGVPGPSGLAVLGFRLVLQLSDKRSPCARHVQEGVQRLPQLSDKS